MDFRRYYQWQTIIAKIARILRTTARTARITARIILRIPRTTLRILRMILRTTAEDNLLLQEEQGFPNMDSPMRTRREKAAGHCFLSA